MDNKGFTLIEVILVIAILGILASILLPKIDMYQKSARVLEHNSNIRMLETAATMYLIDNNILNDMEIEYKDLKMYLSGNKEVKPIRGGEKFKISFINGEIKIEPTEVRIEGKEIIFLEKDI